MRKRYLIALVALAVMAGVIGAEIEWPKVKFSIGRHEITMTVTDNGGLTDSCVKIITVIPGDVSQFGKYWLQNKYDLTGDGQYNLRDFAFWRSERGIENEKAEESLQASGGILEMD